MKARFEVRTIKSSWSGKSKKDITDDVFEAEEGQGFDKISANGSNESVYQLLKIAGERAVVKYSKLFTLKTVNPGDNQLVMEKDKPVEMTYMWGEDGVTKKITYRGLQESAAPAAETTAPQ